MKQVVYEFSGHNKIPIPIIYKDNFDYNVKVYDDSVVIYRSGRLRKGLQEETTIYFSDVTNVAFYSQFDVTWIIFSIPGIDQSSNVITTASVTKNVAISAAPKEAETIPWDNTYAICNYVDKNKTLKEHFYVIRDVYREYREKVQNDSNTPIIIQKEDDVSERLKKLKELLDLGILMKEEYESKREVLISKL